MKSENYKQEEEAWLQTPDGQWGLKMSEQLADFADSFRKKFFPNDTLGYDLIIWGDKELIAKVEPEMTSARKAYDHIAYHFYDNLLALPHLCLIPDLHGEGKNITGKEYVISELGKFTQELNKHVEEGFLSGAFDIQINLKDRTFDIKDLDLKPEEIKDFWKSGTQLPIDK